MYCLIASRRKLDRQPLPQWMPRFEELMALYPQWQK